MSEHTVDSWRFAGGFIQRALSSQIPDVPGHDPIPWAPADRRLAECKVALLSTAGLSMLDDEPFDMEMERRRPTQGDPSWRRLPATARTGQMAANHLHIDTAYIERDLNVALPLDRLHESVAGGEVGAAAESHYSIMGYQGNDTSRLVEESAPAIAAAMQAEEVDLALLAPV